MRWAAKLFNKVKERLTSTRQTIVAKMENIFRRHGKVDADALQELEDALIAADVGVKTTLDLIDSLKHQLQMSKARGEKDLEWLKTTVKSLLRQKLEENTTPIRYAAEGPTVVLIVGVNGTGKTTAIGKLAHLLRTSEEKKVLLVAADTFRAAAIEQLEIWSTRAQVDIIKGNEGSDPAAVVFDALQAAKARKYDVVLIDTAGRLQTKVNLMKELEKIGRIISREAPGGPHETYLVLDANTGQNGLTQATIFAGAVPLTGIILTKMDGTAKGGISVAIKDQLKLPIRYLGVGEGLEDLEPFDRESFLDALFAEDNGAQ